VLQRRIQGFTALVVLALGAGAAGCADAGPETTEQQLRSVQDAMVVFKLKHHRYPDTSEGLAALVAEGLFDAVPQDGWSRDFVYLNEGGRYQLLSYGSDGAPGGEGAAADISNHTLDERPRR